MPNAEDRPIWIWDHSVSSFKEFPAGSAKVTTFLVAARMVESVAAAVRLIKSGSVSFRTYDGPWLKVATAKDEIPSGDATFLRIGSGLYRRVVFEERDTQGQVQKKPEYRPGLQMVMAPCLVPVRTGRRKMRWQNRALFSQIYA